MRSEIASLLPCLARTVGAHLAGAGLPGMRAAAGAGAAVGRTHASWAGGRRGETDATPSGQGHGDLVQEFNKVRMRERWSGKRAVGG